MDIDLRPAGWEDVCVQCGLCCLVKIATKEHDVFLTKILCDHLDKKTKKCKCYSADFDKRDSDGGGCAAHDGSNLNMRTLKNDYIVPGCCPYVKKFVKNNSLKMPEIDFETCTYEKDLKKDDLAENYIISNSWRLFKYNKTIDKKIK